MSYKILTGRKLKPEFGICIYTIEEKTFRIKNKNVLHLIVSLKKY